MNATFWSDGVEGTARELENRGVELTIQPTKQDWGTSAAFKDSEGNTFLIGSK